MQFQFAGVVESDRHYPIQVESVQTEKVLEECEKIIARHPTGPYFEIDKGCDGDYHSEKCRIGLSWDQPCIRVDAEEAKHRRKGLILLSCLKDCARDPARADGLCTLKGLVQESSIYDMKYSSTLLFPSLLPSSRKLHILT